MKQIVSHVPETMTRKNLIVAGKKLFGLHGFDATSTRALAEEAGANLSAIPYYFGGKTGLYRAVAESIVATKHEEIGYTFDQVLDACADPSMSRESLLGIMRDMVVKMVESMLGNQDSRDFSQIMMQEQISPTDVFDVFYEGFVKKAVAAWSALLGRFSGLKPGSEELTLRAFSVLGQLVIFRVGMAAVLRHLGCEKLSRDHLEIITAVVINQLEAIVSPVSPESRGEAL